MIILNICHAIYMEVSFALFNIYFRLSLSRHYELHTVAFFLFLLSLIILMNFLFIDQNIK
jgi:hypothetical protein